MKFLCYVIICIIFYLIYELCIRIKCLEDNEIEKLMNFLCLCYVYIMLLDV